MVDFRKRKPSKKLEVHAFSPDEHARWDALKSKALANVLGPMDDIVSHAVIPYELGGHVDLYHYEQALPGTALVTMELVRPDGSGPLPSRIGTYELLAFTRHRRAGDHASYDAFTERLCGTFTTLGRYGEQAVLEPGQSATIPWHDGLERVVLFAQHERFGSFQIGRSKHGLLTCIEIHPFEVEFAQEHGSEALIDALRSVGAYPYSDLDRPAID